jgi:ATP-dependent Zn protease
LPEFLKALPAKFARSYTAELTDGYSGASLAALLNEASILSVRADRDMVNLDDIERVIERTLVAGADTRPLSGSP